MATTRESMERESGSGAAGEAQWNPALLGSCLGEAWSGVCVCEPVLMRSALSLVCSVYCCRVVLVACPVAPCWRPGPVEPLCRLYQRGGAPSSPVVRTVVL